MTATAAKKKRAVERDERAQESSESPAGLWIDESSLPTNLAKKNSSKEATVIEFPYARVGSRSVDRILRLADTLLRNPKDMRIIERPMKQKKFKGAKRRSTR